MQDVEIKTDEYQRCLNNASKVNWDIDKDVFRSRSFDVSEKFLPETLSRLNELSFLSDSEQIFASQIQGRTYAYIFGLVERFINSKIMELGQEHVFGDQVVLEALVQFSREELKHQDMFRRIEQMTSQHLPEGYTMVADPDDVARIVMSKSTWAVLALTCHIEIFTQVHYLESIKPEENVSALFKDIFKYHWLEEAQHAKLDELEWERLHASCSQADLEEGVSDLIELIQAVDGILQAQAEADANYFINNMNREVATTEQDLIKKGFLKAYRWQYLVSGFQIDRFQKALFGKLNDEQTQRILDSVDHIIDSVISDT
jgi:hypothetical protein